MKKHNKKKSSNCGTSCGTGCLHIPNHCPHKEVLAYLNRHGSTHLKDGVLVNEKDWRSRQTGGWHIGQKGEKYPYGMDRTVYPHMFEEFIEADKDPSIIPVTPDIFDPEMPKELVGLYLDIFVKYPQHKFLCVTEYPGEMLPYAFPENTWVGTTVTSDKDEERKSTLIQVNAPLKVLDIRPLLGPVTFSFEGLRWIIVGDWEGRNPITPASGWIDGIVAQAANLGIPVYMHENMRQYARVFIQEFPQ